MNKEILITIQDECTLMGAPAVIKKNGGYLVNITQRIAENYDSPNFDRVVFQTDLELADENCAAIIEAAELLKETLEKLRKEVIGNDEEV